mmetsp:Transcript_2151/g.3393  ORF Transcript_2151/g.3393 Transcript_2151/m.3393 type:complete len:127 (-) Transcript_2151:927-1307(-)
MSSSEEGSAGAEDSSTDSADNIQEVDLVVGAVVLLYNQERRIDNVAADTDTAAALPNTDLDGIACVDVVVVAVVAVVAAFLLLLALDSSRSSSFAKTTIGVPPLDCHKISVEAVVWVGSEKDRSND